MLRYQVRVTVYHKNEETNRREIDFPHDEAFIKHTKEEIEFLIKGVHLIGENGEVYVLDIANIGVI